MIVRPPVWVVELTAYFWTLAGSPPPFPRDLRTAICWVPHLHVLEVAGLTLASAADALSRWNVPSPVSRENRALAGCFTGYRGCGFILIDAGLETAEKRFTLAHEVAHFLRDYDRVRR